jgi:hypothetical protein
VFQSPPAPGFLTRKGTTRHSEVNVRTLGQLLRKLSPAVSAGQDARLLQSRSLESRHQRSALLNSLVRGGSPAWRGENRLTRSRGSCFADDPNAPGKGEAEGVAYEDRG